MPHWPGGPLGHTAPRLFQKQNSRATIFPHWMQGRFCRLIVNSRGKKSEKAETSAGTTTKVLGEQQILVLNYGLPLAASRGALLAARVQISPELCPQVWVPSIWCP